MATLPYDPGAVASYRNGGRRTAGELCCNAIMTATEIEMRRKLLTAALTLALVLGSLLIGDEAEAACTTVGSPLASSDLTCTHVPGANENAFRDWIANSWAPAAIEDYFRTLIAYDPTRDWSMSIGKIGYAYEKWTSIEQCCFFLMEREFGTQNKLGFVTKMVEKPGVSADFHDERDFSSALLTITLTDYVNGVFHYTYTMSRANWNLFEQELLGRFGPVISGTYPASGSATSVPGPIAGAGLPTLLAFAWFVRRRARRGPMAA